MTSTTLRKLFIFAWFDKDFSQKECSDILKALFQAEIEEAIDKKDKVR